MNLQIAETERRQQNRSGNNSIGARGGGEGEGEGCVGPNLEGNEQYYFPHQNHHISLQLI